MRQLLFLATFFIYLGVAAQDSKGHSITIEITNIENNKGEMVVGIYDTVDNWLKTPYKGVYGKIENGASNVSFTDVPNGTYAVSLYHDENDNGKLDTNFLGIPTEDTGASNDAPARMGPPRWEDAKFEIKGKSINQTIKL